MLDEYKESFRNSANLIPNWETKGKNELCREYVAHKGDERLQNAYFAAIVYRYWNLIAKYYYMSSNVASPEDCYEWLIDSVYGCLKATSWDNPNTSIYNDPNGPDKVINRCMKCARLTYYQFINRKKRKDNFGLLSIDEMTESFGATLSEPEDTTTPDKLTEWAIGDFIRNLFDKKDYFTAILVDCIINEEVFDVTTSFETGTQSEFNVRKLARFISEIDDNYIAEFARRYKLNVEDVNKGVSYFKDLKTSTLRAKAETVLERLQHDSFIKLLRGG